MKGKILGVLVLVLLSLGFGAGSARAQQAAVTVVADIPFSFMVERTLLPPGKYEFAQTYDEPWEWSVSDAKGMVKVLFSTEPAEMMNPPRSYEVTFDVIGGKYFLSNIWLASDSDGFYVAMTGAEKGMLKQGVKPKEERVPAKKKGM